MSSYLLSGRGALFSRLSTDGSLCLFGEFSGQGRPWLSSLRELDAWAQSAQHQPMQQLIQQSLQVVQEMSQDEEAQAVGVFRQGFDVRSWIDQPEQAPAEAYLSASDTLTAHSPRRPRAQRGLRAHFCLLLLLLSVLCACAQCPRELLHDLSG